MKMNEEATFAVYQKKLKGICEENDLQATFNRSGYPLTMTVRPLQDVAGKNPGAGWYQMMRGDAAEEHVVLARDPAPNQFAANGKKPVRRGGS